MKLRTLAPAAPGQFRLQAKAKHWFSAADADQPAATTTLHAIVGSRCFSHVATKKTD